MAKCRFLYDNKWNTGTLTASSENANFPASRTRHRWHTRTWRTEDTYITDQWLKLNRGSSSPAITAAAIRFNNFTGETISIQGHASDSWGSPTYNQAWTVNNKIMVHFLISSQALQWWRFLMTNTVVSYVEVGWVFLGTYFEPARNFNYGVAHNPEDPSLIQYSEGGQISTIQRPKYFGKDYTFSHFKQTEKEEFDVVFDAVGYSKGFIFVEDPDDAYNTSYYVRFTKFEWKFVVYDNWSLTLGVEELR